MAWHCTECNSTNVQTQIWAVPNDTISREEHEYMRMFCSCEKEDWCSDCLNGDGKETTIEWRDPPDPYTHIERLEQEDPL